jgi:hypothetical protein
MLISYASMPKLSTTRLPVTHYQALMQQKSALIVTTPGTFRVKNLNQKRPLISDWMKSALAAILTTISRRFLPHVSIAIALIHSSLPRSLTTTLHGFRLPESIKPSIV